MNNLERVITESLFECVENIHPSENLKRKIFNQMGKRSGKKYIKFQPVFIIGILILLLSVGPVYAVIGEIDWHGMNFSISSKSATDNIKMIFERSISLEKEARAAMNRSINSAQKTYTEAEASRDFGFMVARPKNSPLQLVKSIGIENSNKEYSDRFVFWDMFKSDKNWVYVRQMLDYSKTQYINNNYRSKTSPPSHTYAKDYKKIDISENCIGFIKDVNSSEKVMWINFINSKNEVIELLINSNVSEEKMVEVAKSYSY